MSRSYPYRCLYCAVAVVLACTVAPRPAVGKSKCFPREGHCIAVAVNGQAAVKLTKKDRRGLEPYSERRYVGDVETWIPEPIRGELDVSGRFVAGSEEWFGAGPGFEAAVVALDDVSLDVSRSLDTADSVRIGGEAVVVERLDLEDNRLPPGAYLLRVTIRGADNWDRATVFFRVAGDP